MPATPRTTPVRMRVAPPARSSERRIRPRAPRTKSSAATPQAAASGIAQAASIRLIPAVWRARRIPPGTASVPTRPSSTAIEARWLLLRIGTADGGGRNRAADHTGHGDERQGVGQRLEENGVRAPVGDGAEALRERGREAEEERCSERAARPPLAEDEGGERDEAATLGHVLGEGVHEADREVRPAERSKHSGQGDRSVAGAVDADPDDVRCPRILADGADAEPERRLEDEHPRQRERREGEPDEEVELAERLREEVPT